MNAAHQFRFQLIQVFRHIYIRSLILHFLSPLFISHQLWNPFDLSWDFCTLWIVLQCRFKCRHGLQQEHANYQKYSAVISKYHIWSITGPLPRKKQEGSICIHRHIFPWLPICIPFWNIPVAQQKLQRLKELKKAWLKQYNEMKFVTFSHCGFNVIVVSASASALLSLTRWRNAAARLLKNQKYISMAYTSYKYMASKH